MIDKKIWRDWADLAAHEQLSLRQEYAHYLDDLPPTCDPDEKVGRFREWRANYHVRYEPDTGGR